MRSVRLLAGALLLATLGGCDGPAPATAQPRETIIGGDRDIHGCIGSAGYRWCAREGRCVRPWELAATRRFVVTEEALDAWCARQPDGAPRPAP